MKHLEAERKIKALQKKFLSWLEEHPELEDADSTAFNDLRKEVFKVTFEAYRYGVIGFDNANDGPRLWRDLFGWIPKHPAVENLPEDIIMNIAGHGFAITLQAFRIGAMVAGENDLHD